MCTELPHRGVRVQSFLTGVCVYRASSQLYGSIVASSLLYGSIVVWLVHAPVPNVIRFMCTVKTEYLVCPYRGAGHHEGTKA